eukprot:TRINITY_DN68128_c7_g2_i1.p1 TRINITY_DN68128_c7_g2~~TRINITY_DN68128_c7_g2_i1.p1  ORF type:complete len:502 (-),score=31.54 TRINITY_DN68128_c7_g2_i1:356-1672(-)
MPDLKTWYFRRPPNSGWGTIDPVNIEYILKTNFSNYGVTPFRADEFHDFIGNGIFNADGDLWKLQRKTASYEFSNARFRTWFQTRFVKHANELVAKLRHAAETKTTIDMQSTFADCTLDSVCDILYGIDLSTWSRDERNRISIAFNAATRDTLLRYTTPLKLWKLFKFLNIGKEKELKQQLKILDELCYSVISERKKLSAEEIEEKHDLLSRFVSVSSAADDEYLKTDKFVRDMVMSLFLAGRDTTSNCLSWLFVLLDQNPTVQDKLAQEIEACVPAGCDPTFDHMKAMHYTQAVVSETLRLYPSVPEDPKVALSDDVLPSGGFKVKKGQIVGFVPLVMGHSEELWGPDVEEFKPERWLHPDTGEYVRQSPYKFTAFQAGPRQCLGQDMANLEVKTILTMIVREGYKLRVVEGFEPRPDLDLTLSLRGGLPMRVFTFF